MVGVHASTPATGTITYPTNMTVLWTGSTLVANPTIGLGTSFDPSTCQAAMYCDLFTLNLNVPQNLATLYPNYFLNVSMSWANPQYDYDLYVYHNGLLVGSGTLSAGTSYENVYVQRASAGTYQVYADNWEVAPNTPYNGNATLALTPPPYSFPTRNAVSIDDTAGKFAGTPYTFTPDLRLVGAQSPICSSVGICSQDVEPGIKIDQFGTIYAAAIQGSPAGTDFWRSTNGGTSFTYLGQPDGAQNPTFGNATFGGVGGGDEDIALGSPFVLVNSNGVTVNSTGRVYLSSLFSDGTGVAPPESITVANSINQGNSWAVSQTSVPIDDRQWTVANGPMNYYISYNDFAAALGGVTNLVMLQSIDGGLTFTNGAFIGKQLGADISAFQGPMVITPGGTIYDVYTASATNTINLVKCASPCSLPALGSAPASNFPFRVTTAFVGPRNMSTVNVFPQVAVDKAGNIYIAWSTGRNIYLIGSSDDGNTWTRPVQVNQGPETATAIEPWLQAGDNGHVGLIWYGTNVTANSPDNFTAFANAQWKLFYSLSPNALSSSPTFYQVVASGGTDLPDGVVHHGAICTVGTACPAGTRNLAEYSSFTFDANGMANIVFAEDANTPDGLAQTDFTKQTAGPTSFAPSLGRTTGVGNIVPNGDQDHFKFRVDSTQQGITGQLQYLDSGAQLLFTSNSVTGFTENGNQATFSGTGVLNNGILQTTVGFTVSVTGNHNTGPDNDRFSIQLTNGYSASGIVESGNIKVLSASQT